MIEFLKKVLDFLKEKNEYEGLVNRINTNYSVFQSLAFEAFFAYIFESENLSLEYEVDINKENDKTVDFVYKTTSRKTLAFELVSPEISAEMRQEEKKLPEGFYGSLLTSDNEQDHLTPEAQVIRLQEKIREKVEKFPVANEEVFSIIVVNCKNFYSGGFDKDDCRMVMHGKTRVQYNQMYWKGNPIKGLLDETLDTRSAKEFRERVSAVIFIPKFKPDMLEDAFIVANCHRTESYIETWEKELIELTPLRSMLSKR